MVVSDKNFCEVANDPRLRLRSERYSRYGITIGERTQAKSIAQSVHAILRRIVIRVYMRKAMIIATRLSAYYIRCTGVSVNNVLERPVRIHDVYSSVL